VSELRIFDFHIHGGDVSRTGEIAEYIKTEELDGAVLLSLPLSGYPGARFEQTNLNAAVLESKRLLNTGIDAGPPVFAFGSLDNRALLTGDAWDPARQVAALAQTGFDGLKLWEGKPELAAALGLMPDDSRLVEACREAGRQNMPVLFHIADPPEFWDREAGERFLSENDVPEFKALIRSAARLCHSVPETTIVFPHLLFLGGNLKNAADFLDESPNALFDLAPGNYFYEPLSNSSEKAAEFFQNYRYRILFGSDALFIPLDFGAFPGESLSGNKLRCHRLLEFLSTDKMVDNPYPLVPEGRRNSKGLALPKSTLDPILHGNARRILADSPRAVSL
jgi:predicted TIM-barrel fold metal-dependent hydrolase